MIGSGEMAAQVQPNRDRMARGRFGFAPELEPITG